MKRAVVLVALIAAGCGEEAPATAPPSAATRETATVERTDLVDRENLSGTLGYADAGTLGAGVSGTLTSLRAPGTVVTRGHSLYGVDGAPAAFLLYGDLPAWRDLAPGMADGEDIRQLERNLKALGYDPGTVDDDWDWETTDAVQAFQADRGLDDTGKLTRGQVVFRPGATRIGEGKAQVGDAVAPGRPVAEISATGREVVVKLDARRQQLAHRGDAVTVELPTGKTVKGRVESVGTVASKPDGRLVAVEPGLYADDLVEVSGDGVREGMQVVTAR